MHVKSVAELTAFSRETHRSAERLSTVLFRQVCSTFQTEATADFTAVSDSARHRVPAPQPRRPMGRPCSCTANADRSGSIQIPRKENQPREKSALTERACRWFRPLKHKNAWAVALALIHRGRPSERYWDWCQYQTVRVTSCTQVGAVVEELGNSDWPRGSAPIASCRSSSCDSSQDSSELTNRVR